MLPVLRISAEGPLRVPQAAEKIADDLDLSQEERDELLPNGKQRILHNRIHWAKFYMSKAGLIESPARGIFTASQSGKALLATNPNRISLDVLKQYPSFVEFYGSAATSAPAEGINSAQNAVVSTPTPEEQMGGAYALLQSALKTELLGGVDKFREAFLRSPA